MPRKPTVCLRCGHKWFLRQAGKPMVCAKCHSPYWDRPRAEKGSSLPSVSSGESKGANSSKPAR